MVMPTTSTSSLSPLVQTQAILTNTLQLIIQFFQDPDLISDNSIRHTLSSQFEKQVLELKKFDSDDNHLFFMELNGKTYEVYQFTDKDKLESFQRNERITFMTSKGSVEKSIPSMRAETNSESNVLLISDFGKVFSFILKDKNLPVGDVDILLQSNKKEAFEFFYLSLRKQPTVLIIESDLAAPPLYNNTDPESPHYVPSKPGYTRFGNNLQLVEVDV